jgi:hypothetical protein
MSELENINKIIDLLTSLIDSLAQYWDKRELNYMRTSVECGEYGEPLKNLIATGLKSGDGFGANQMAQIETLITLTGMEDSEWVGKLRQFQRGEDITFDDITL